MGHEVQFGTIGLAPTTHSVFFAHASSHRLPMAQLPIFEPTPHFTITKKNADFLSIINVQIPFQF